MRTMKQLRVHTPGPQRARGFSLVEILVGVAIGVVGMLVIFKTIATWDTHTRSTSAGSDAQSAGALAMFNLERDIKQAGQGFMGIGPAPAPPAPPAPNSLGCAVNGVDTQTGRNLAFNMVPVEIVLTGGQPDTINVLYGNSPFFVSEERFALGTATTKQLARGNGFKTGDLAIAAVGMNCNLLQVTDDTGAIRTITHAAGVTFPNFYAVPAAPMVARYNSSALPALGPDGTIYSLGPTPRRASWVIDTAAGNLTSTELFGGAPAFVVGEGVVNMKALYGLDADGDRRVDSWTNVAPADWAQVLSVRVAMLVRSRQFERTADQSASGVPAAVTPNVPNWSGDALGLPNTAFVMTNVDGSPDAFGPNDPNPLNWRFYRYRVYEKEIPLRNVIWGMTP